MQINDKHKEKEVPVPDLHVECKTIISSQMQFISSLKTKVEEQKTLIQSLKDELLILKRTSVKGLKKMVNWHKAQSKRKSEEVENMRQEIKRIRLEPELPGPSTPADGMITELIKRRHAPKTEKYSEILRNFSFKLNYVAPVGFKVARKMLPGILPHPKSFYKWTNHVKIVPGACDNFIPFIYGESFYFL